MDLAENCSEYLATCPVPCHLPGRGGARGIRSLEPGVLLLIDEDSMMSTPDLLDIIRHSERSGTKVLVAEDRDQFAAVEAGGGPT